MSLILPQKMRPKALKIAKIATGSRKRARAPSPAGANDESPKMSRIIGVHWPIAIRPDVAPKIKVIHSIVASGVLSISRQSSSAIVFCLTDDGFQPAGFHPAGGLRNNMAPRMTIVAQTMPCSTKKARQPMPLPLPSITPNPIRIIW